MKRSDFQLIAIVGIILGVLLLAGGIYASFYYESYMIIRIYRVYPYAAYSGSLLRAGAISIFLGIASVLLAPKMSETKINETKPSETKSKKMVRRSVAIALARATVPLPNPTSYGLFPENQTVFLDEQWNSSDARARLYLSITLLPQSFTGSSDRKYGQPRTSCPQILLRK